MLNTEEKPLQKALERRLPAGECFKKNQETRRQDAGAPA
jgi:hypothetical protein